MRIPVRFYALALFCVPLGVAIAGRHIFDAFSSEHVDVLTQFDIVILTAGSIQHTQEAALGAQGYLYATTLLALGVACVAAVAVSVLVIARDNTMHLWLRAAFVILAAVASVASFCLLTSVGEQTSTIKYLGAGVFDHTLGDYWTRMSFPLTLTSWVDITNALGVCGAVFISICVCAIAPPAPDQPDQAAVPVDPEVAKAAVQRMVEDLEARTRWLKYLLFGASAVLISAVANMQAWRGWPVPVLKAVDAHAAKAASASGASATAKHFEAFANATTQYHAFLFVLILIAIFLPMAIWLQRRALALSETAKTSGLTANKTPAVWRKENGLSLSFSEGMQRVVAVISPLLIGPMLELVKVGIAVGG